MKSFKIEKIFTWGLVADKDYGGFKLPVSFRDQPKVVTQINKLVVKLGTKAVFYGDSQTVYFKIWNISENQSRNLLDKGRCFVDIEFTVDEKAVESRKNTGDLFLGLRVTGLRRNSNVTVESTPKDEF